MTKFFRCLTAILLIQALCAAAGAEAFAPAADAILNSPGGASLTVSLEGIKARDEEITRLLNGFFDGLEACVTAGDGGGTVSFRWGGTQAVLSGGLLTEKADDVSLLLFHAEDLIKECAALKDAWYAHLDEGRDDTRNYLDRTYVKNAGSSASAVEYSFTREEMPDVQAVFTDLKEGYPLAALAWSCMQRWTGFDFDDAVFTGRCVHKRLFDKEGAPMGAATDGRIAFDDEAEYRFTSLMGRAPGRGGNFSLELNRVRGTGQHRYILGWKVTEKANAAVIELTGSVISKTKDHSLNVSLQGTVTVKRTDTESISADITVNANRDGLRSVRAARADLNVSEGLASGKASVSLSLAGEDTWSVDLSIGLMPGGSDTAALTDTETVSRIIYEEAFKRLSALSEEDRVLLTHTLFSARWLDINDEPIEAGEWSVEEE